jgi:hypothetical protein
MAISPEGTAERANRLSRPFGPNSSRVPLPNVETLGYSQMSLRDRLTGAAPVIWRSFFDLCGY